MTTEIQPPGDPDQLDTTLAAERLCMALLKLEADVPGGLEALRGALTLPIELADVQAPKVASVWRRFADLAESVRRDLEWVSTTNG